MRGEILNITSNGLRFVARAAWALILPRLLGVEDFGTYVLIQGTAQILSAVAVLGAPMVALTGRMSMLPLLTNTLLLGLALSLGSFLFIGGGSDRLFILIAVQLLSLDLLLGAWARGKGAFRQLVIAYAIGYALFAVVFAAMVLANGTVTVSDALWLSVLGAGASMVALLLLMRGQNVAAAQVTSWREVLGPVYLIGGQFLIDVIIWRRIEIYFLNESPSGAVGVAVFGLAIQLAATTLILPAAVLESWFPQFSETWANERGRFADALRAKLRRYRLVYAGICAVALAGFALFIPFVYPAYQNWEGLILLLIAIRLIVGYVGFHSTVLYATGRAAGLYVPTILGAGVALAANALLTLPYGLAALPVAYALTHGVTALGTWWAYRRAASAAARRDAAVASAGASTP